jgi:HNH endonuclease
MNFYARTCRWCLHPTFRISLDEALKKCARRDGNCLLWTAGTCNTYPAMTLDGIRVYVHRAVYEAANGPLPEGFDALHTCDNTLCVELHHLWKGTRRDNNLDRHRKGRTASGSRNGHSKLNEESVVLLREAYARGEKLKDLERQFRVEMGTILPAVRGETWALAGGPRTLAKRKPGPKV